MSLALITGPALESLTIAEVRRQLILGDTAGEPAPTAPTVALSAVAGNVTAGAHRYLVTHVTADGETEAGDASAAVTTILATHGQVLLTNIQLGGTLVTSRKLYRTAAGGSTYLLLATLSNNAATTYTDNIADGSLGAEAPATNTTADPQLTLLIQMARDRAEQATSRALLTQTWDYYLDQFPNDIYIEIPKPPLASITSLKYKDTAGTLQTWAATNYIVEAPAGPRCQCGRLGLVRSVVWPARYGAIADIVIRFVAGNTTAAGVPPMLKAAMLLDIGTLWAQREGVITGTIVADFPMGVPDIYRSFKAHQRQRIG